MKVISRYLVLFDESLNIRINFIQFNLFKRKMNILNGILDSWLFYVKIDSIDRWRVFIINNGLIYWCCIDIEINYWFKIKLLIFLSLRFYATSLICVHIFTTWPTEKMWKHKKKNVPIIHGQFGSKNFFPEVTEIVATKK